jgi:carbon monoxide dehydrogenase subunit G
MKTKIIKKIRSFFLLQDTIGGYEVFAQMGKAQKREWDIEKKVNVNASQSSVWCFLNEVDMLVRFSNGYVASAEIKSKDFPLTMNFVFSNGYKRSVSVVQSDAENKFMVIEINKESLLKGVTNGLILIFIRAVDDGNSSVNWAVKIDGGNPGKQIVIDQLKAEIESYAIGFGKIINTVGN